MESLLLSIFWYLQNWGYYSEIQISILGCAGGLLVLLSNFFLPPNKTIKNVSSIPFFAKLNSYTILLPTLARYTHFFAITNFAPPAFFRYPLVLPALIATKSKTFLPSCFCHPYLTQTLYTCPFFITLKLFHTVISTPLLSIKWHWCKKTWDHEIFWNSI